jgi:transposase
VAQVNDLSRSLTAFDPISTLVVVVEMSKASWLVSGAVPGVERQPLKKLEPDATALLRLIERWRNEAMRSGRPISRIALAYEAGRDGFWLARWLIARGIEAHVIHSASVAVSRERKRAKTDCLDAAMLMRVFLGWLRGERGHCGMVVIPTMEEEAARRPSRTREPYARIGPVRICAGCALKAHVTQPPGMAAAAKLSQQPRTESCVVSGNGHCEA